MEELKRYEDVFSIPVQGANGQEMYLEQFRGKVLMFINTTGHCGNTSQWPVLDALQEEYKDKPFQIVYVPTNDYCGSVTFGEYKKGIKDGQASADYAKETFGIEAPFTELLSSRNTPWEYKVAHFDTDTKVWTMNPEEARTLTQPPRSELFNFLFQYPAENKGDHIQGNFHKIFTNKKGVPMVHASNDTLNEKDDDDVVNYDGSVRVIKNREQELADFKRVIDELIATDTYNHEGLSGAWSKIE